MTQRQIELLYAASLRRDATRRAANLVDTNQAFAGGKNAGKHLATLQKCGD